ncbi:MaoC family dehydratase [Actinophytocola gossypii]|uniref:MaoC family dehydratase n=1 Tax=Actinophytocola gossypii TaxID=2812003 RepID=A0ABT2J7U8_9PSEU|nr:MaoC family dehydratase [Actinophytocola gossypii]MCT2583359.1 MaoC family dehydratase [Actinophytocola gossypii]
MRTFADLDELTAAAGEHLGHSDWLEVTQDRVDRFADATGDHQWIHVDTERAKDGPFGGTIAHGYLTLSLIPLLGKQVYSVDNVTMGINYGLEKVRFPALLPVGSKIRVGAELLAVADKPRGKQATLRWTIEVQGGDKPACVAETIVLYVP